MRGIAVSRVLVIGYGNPSRRDDGVGHYVVKALRRRSGEVVDVLSFHQLVPELAERVADYDLVIFVDAHTNAYGEGLEIRPLRPDQGPSALSHHVRPEMVLAMAKALYGGEPRAFVFSIRGYDFGFGTELSEGTRKHADMAIERILEMVRNRGHGQGDRLSM
ncbi:MAG TPA: hydrogenase maturation protease [Anaerolineae bacterium]|nr:hydrogenase maturation protease [Anaerolineae bacterium]